MQFQKVNSAGVGMRKSRKFCERGSKFDNILLFFLVDEGMKDPNLYKWAIIGPPAKHHLNGVSLAGL